MTTDRAALIMDLLQTDATFAVEFDRFIAAQGWDAPVPVQAIWADECPDDLWIVANSLWVGWVTVAAFPDAVTMLLSCPMGMN